MTSSVVAAGRAGRREVLVRGVRGRLFAALGRIVQALPIVIGVTILTFLLVHLIPGDPARALLGPRATPAAIQALRAQWGIDEPLPLQYWDYLLGLLHGNMGTSLFYDRPILPIIGSFLAPTLWLIVGAGVVSVVISVPLAMAAAMWRGKVVDQVIRLVSQVGLGAPQPWVGLLLILVLSLKVSLFPVAGFGDGLSGHVWSMLLPSLTVALGMAPILIRSLRAQLIETLQSDFITTARSKGIGGGRVLVIHALRNASISALTILGLNLAWLVSQTVVVEAVFALPGLGNLLVNSILRRDFPVVQGLALVFALTVIVINVATDIARSVLDPRVSV